MAENEPKLAELTAMIESIVAQVLTKSFGEQMATWSTNNARTSLYLSHETGDRNRFSGADQVFGAMSQTASYATELNKLRKTESKNLGKFAGGLGGLAGVYGAYQSGDSIGGAMSGYQLGKTLGFGHPLIGAAIGLLAGLFSPGVDKWQRPKFKNAKQAFDKLFTMDRGERDDYYMPDSFYFRTGGQPKKIVVNVGNNQFGDYIRESLTNEYESQLVRGLVF